MNKNKSLSNGLNQFNLLRFMNQRKLKFMRQEEIMVIITKDKINTIHNRNMITMNMPENKKQFQHTNHSNSKGELKESWKWSSPWRPKEDNSQNKTSKSSSKWSEKSTQRTLSNSSWPGLMYSSTLASGGQPLACSGGNASTFMPSNKCSPTRRNSRTGSLVKKTEDHQRQLELQFQSFNRYLSQLQWSTEDSRL